MEEEYKKDGIEIIKKWRFSANGYPILSHVVRTKTGTVVCQMYVGMLIATNAAYISYRPPDNDLEHGLKVWTEMIDPLVNWGPTGK